jgi:multidrug efflux pump subunit AcrB
MWIVQLALRRPYTFIVLALLIFVFGPVLISRTPTDIFPNINIPVVAVTFQYTGLNPEAIEGQGWLRLLGQKFFRDKWFCLSG